MKNVLTPKTLRFGLLLAGILLISGLAVIALQTDKKSHEQSVHGNSSYELSPQEIAELAEKANRGDCDAAYKIGRHHLYVSLDYAAAEKFFRLAAVCPNVEAKLGLITVLRGPEHDAEVDAIARSLKDLDKKAWEDASKEVTNRRTYREKH